MRCRVHRLGDDLRARLRILQIVEQLSVLRRPRRHARSESVPTRGVRIHRRAHILPGDARRVDLVDHLGGLRPRVSARGLEMIDLHRHAARAPDRERFVDRLEQRVALRANVRDVDAVIWRHCLRDLAQLVRPRVIPRRIDQRARDAERAIAHRIARHSAHRVELRRTRRPLRLAVRVRADRPGADERADVDRVAVLLHRVEPRAEAVRAHELLRHANAVRVARIDRSRESCRSPAPACRLRRGSRW